MCATKILAQLDEFAAQAEAANDESRATDCVDYGIKRLEECGFSEKEALRQLQNVIVTRIPNKAGTTSPTSHPNDGNFFRVFVELHKRLIA